MTLAMALIGAIAFMLNRDNGMHARMIRLEADVDRARYVAEAGLQAVNYQVQQKGCAGGYATAAFPVANASFGGGSYSAYADRASGFPVILTSTGTYNDTSVTLTRSNVLVFQSPARSTTLQPAADAGLDTYVDSAQPTRNYGGANGLWIGSDGPEPLVKFDLAALPGGARIVPWYDGTALQPGAALSLYQINAPAATSSLGVYLVTHGWAEGSGNGGGIADGATWNTFDGTSAWPAPGVGYDPRMLSSRPYVAANGWNTWDITDAASAWAGSVYPNHGVWLRVAAGTLHGAQFASSDFAADATQRPKLVLNYLVPCALNPPPLTLYAAADAYIDNGTANAEYYRNYGAAPSLYAYRSRSRQVRTLLRFDLASLPPGSTVMSAKLRLYVTSTSHASRQPKTIYAYALLQSWLEGTSTGATFPDGASYYATDGVGAWATAGGSHRTPSVATAVQESSGASPPPSDFRTGWLYWDLTTLVREWASGTTANNGVILISTVGDQPVFPSDENGNAAYRPQLVVTYK